MALRALLLCSVLKAGLVAGGVGHPPWLDTALDATERARRVVSAMTLAEKLSMLQGDTVLDANGTGVNACIGHLPGHQTTRSTCSVFRATGRPGLAMA